MVRCVTQNKALKVSKNFLVICTPKLERKYEVMPYNTSQVSRKTLAVCVHVALIVGVARANL